MRHRQYFIHINKIYVLVFCIYNNDYQSGVICTAMRDNDFFSWRRDMLHQFQSVAAGERFIISCNEKPKRWNYDYYTLCVRHPVPFTRPRVTFQSTYPRAWMSHYQAENYFAIDPVLRPENFMRGHLPWEDGLFRDAAALSGRRPRSWSEKRVTQCLTLPNHAQGFSPSPRITVYRALILMMNWRCACAC